MKVLAISASILILSSCSLITVKSAPAPIIQVKQCEHFAFAQPNPAPKLPGFALIKCKYAACFDKANAEKLQRELSMLIQDDAYMRDFYTKQLDAYNKVTK